MTRFRVTYSREFSKIIYARNAQEAMWKFNRQADDRVEFIEARPEEKLEE